MGLNEGRVWWCGGRDEDDRTKTVSGGGTVYTLFWAFREKSRVCEEGLIRRRCCTLHYELKGCSNRGENSAV